MMSATANWTVLHSYMDYVELYTFLVYSHFFNSVIIYCRNLLYNQYMDLSLQIVLLRRVITSQTQSSITSMDPLLLGWSNPQDLHARSLFLNEFS